MRFATIPLKWALISFKMSSSLSFSASKSIRVRSTYSRKRAPRARESRSNAPLVLQRRKKRSKTDAQGIFTRLSLCQRPALLWKFRKVNPGFDYLSPQIWPGGESGQVHLSLMTPESARSSKIRSSCSRSRSLRSLRFLFYRDRKKE